MSELNTSSHTQVPTNPAPGIVHTDSREIPNKTYFRIGDVADLVGVKPYVLRYWETEFPTLSPNKSTTGQRVYRRTDVETLLMIKHLLYEERYSIEGARKRIRDLRKGGELKAFKKEAVQKETGTPAVSQEAQKKVFELADDLERLAKTPNREIFRF